MDSEVYDTKCKGAHDTIKNRVKCRANSDTYYIRHREAVLEKRRAARGAAASEASSICNVYDVMEASSNPVVSFD
jgi:hypothetical protein